MDTIKKLKFLNEACKTTAVNVRCLSPDLTLLINACHEAEQWRKEKGLPQGEKYNAMKVKLEKLAAELDSRIDTKCEALAMMR